MERIVLSSDILPLRLFFNTGSRLRPTEHHYNRWVPTELGDYIENGASMVLFADFDEGQQRDWKVPLFLEGDIEVIYVDHPVPKVQEYTLLDGGYTFHVLCFVDESDEFAFEQDGDKCISTCFFFEERPDDLSPVSRGACLYVTPGQPFVEDVECLSRLEMIYYCLVLLTKSVSDPRRGGDVAFAGRCLKHTVENACAGEEDFNGAHLFEMKCTIERASRSRKQASKDLLAYKEAVKRRESPTKKDKKKAVKKKAVEKKAVEKKAVEKKAVEKKAVGGGGSGSGRKKKTA
ncbi:uncharacterized protein MYCFIDRAFT_78138 [Pseudocercospora fijiensis CIRAD86]|uniref:Uncharacterized protein n=1 Tax=Pseudocercospora fijiensis (strain CIRAD86) TaxID=383855 RepID=M3A700_PSEFD|nr:uncharacterized protein MYCFIDRAFT_78138 [Pseudocercospora fijiensis CIRAD86]EME80396.1 hypothetical protein MYCFIDRAFT_78138 [Pseudocercospora fijiensis CIRAD86]